MGERDSYQITENWGFRKLGHTGEWAIQFKGMDWLQVSDFLPPRDPTTPTTTDESLPKFIAELATLRAKAEAIEAENTRLRAALAQSDQPCAYCSLPADEWAKCVSGFPGCGRADDAMGCPHLSRSVALRAKAKAAEGLAEALERMVHSVCGETGFAAAVRDYTGRAFPWPQLDEAEEEARTALAAYRETLK